MIVWIKAVCSFALVAGCGYIGMTAASRYDLRICQLRGFAAALRVLETEIVVNTVLPEAMQIAGDAAGSVPGNVFTQCANKIEASNGETVYSLWCGCLESVKSRLALEEGEIKTLKEFGIGLGGGDRDSEIKNIRAVLLRLERAESEAAALKAKNARLCRSLGFAAGILISVLLL